MSEEKPKDYVAQSFNEALQEAYESLGFKEKIMYHMQDHVIKVTLFSLVIGYLAGDYFG